MNIAASLEHYSDAQPDAPAILFESSVVSYKELHEATNRVSNVLRSIGICKGDRVALLLPNIPVFAYCYLGAVKIGAVVVSLNSGSTRYEVETALRDSGASVLIAAGELNVSEDAQSFCLLQLRQVLKAGGSLEKLMVEASPRANTVELNAHDPAAILYTSGTTGTPKGATLSHANVLFTMASKRRYLGLTARDRMLLFLPLHHCFGQNAILNSALGTGAAVVLHRSFDAGRILQSIAEDAVTVFCSVPTTFRLMYERATPKQMATVRCFFSAAAPLPVELEDKWEEKFGSVIYQGYGLTETSPFAAYNHLAQLKRGSIGTPIEGVEMKVIDTDTGAAVEAGAKGEIAVRGPNVMLGYWNRPGDTANAIRDGWFYTGDIGRMDTDGYFYMEDRLKDMIIVGGSNVYPAEVETVLYQHAAISEAAVFGVPDTVMGERVKAAVILKAGTSSTSEELIRFCGERLAHIKIPAEVEFVEELPKNRSGKVLKRILRENRERVERRSTAIPKIVSREELETRIAGWLSKHLHIDEKRIDVCTPFAEYGLTSVLAVALAEHLCHWIGRPVIPTITWHFSTIASLASGLIREPESENGDSLRTNIAALSEKEAEQELLGVLEQFVP
jgi:long-chain acyl-CoA synthetase